MTITMPPCKTCKFWSMSYKRDNSMHGNCLRFPPQCHPVGGNERPITNGHDTCGEHHSKEPK